MNPNEIAKMVAPFRKNETGCIPDTVTMMGSADTPSNLTNHQTTTICYSIEL